VDDSLSVISEYGGAPSMMSKADKHLSNMQSNKARELEVLRSELSSKDDEIAQMKKKLSAATARKDTLDN
jgi:hypothetical protein